MKKLIIISALFCVCSGISYASQFGGMNAGTINSEYMRDLRVHEAVTRAKNNSAIISTPKQEAPLQEVANADLKSVIFVNNTAIPSSELLTVIQDKINKPMTAENIASIRRDIMKYYQEKGYFSAVALVSSQNYKDGELVIEVKEGTKNSILIQD